MEKMLPQMNLLLSTLENVECSVACCAVARRRVHLRSPRIRFQLFSASETDAAHIIHFQCPGNAQKQPFRPQHQLYDKMCTICHFDHLIIISLSCGDVMRTECSSTHTYLAKLLLSLVAARHSPPPPAPRSACGSARRRTE